MSVVRRLTNLARGKVKLWQHHSRSDYEKAKLKNAVVSSEGVVRLARQLRPLADALVKFASAPKP